MTSPTRQRIIQCAFELFGRSGFHAVGLDRVIADAGVSKQTFYNHFDGKDDLVLAVLRHRHAVESQTFDQILTATSGRDPRARLYGVFDALEHWFGLPEWKGCLFMRAAAEFPARTDPAHVAAREHADATCAHLKDCAAAAGAADPAGLAVELMVLVEGVLSLHHLSNDVAVVRVAREMSHRLLDERLGGSTNGSRIATDASASFVVPAAAESATSPAAGGPQ